MPEFHISEHTKEALEDAFLDWHGREVGILDDGGTGDVVALYLSLREAAIKADKSLAE